MPCNILIADTARKRAKKTNTTDLAEEQHGGGGEETAGLAQRETIAYTLSLHADDP